MRRSPLVRAMALLLAMASCTASGDDSEPSGSSSCRDSAGDVAVATPSASAPPGIDLENVELSSDGETLTVGFEAAGDMPESTPPGVSGLAWRLLLRPREGGDRQLAALLVGSTWKAGVVGFGQRDGVHDFEEPPEIDGNTLTVKYRLTRLQTLRGPFSWRASAAFGQLFHDSCPEGNELADFPG